MFPSVKNRTFMFEFIRLNLLLFDTKQRLIRLCTEYLATESEDIDQREQHDKTINSCASKSNVDLTIKPEVEIEGTLVKSEMFNDLAKGCTQSNIEEFEGKDFTDDFDACGLKVEVDTERDIEIQEIMANSEFKDFPVLRYTMARSSDTSNTIQRENHQFCNKPLLPIGISRSPTNEDEQDPADVNHSPKLEEYSETEVCQSLNSFSEHESALETYILSEDSDCYRTLLEMGSSTASIVQQQDTISTEDPHHSGFETILSGDTLPFPNLNGLRRKKSKNHCYFCDTEVLNFARHVYRHHSMESKVQEILETPASSKKRKELLSHLRKRGNFKKLKPVRKALNKSYLPCPHCLGLYSKKFLRKHTKTCTKNIARKTGESQVEDQNVLVKIDRPTIRDPLLRESVFPKMRADKVSLVAKKDKLICSFAVRYIKIHRKNFVHGVSQKMRELAKVLIFVQKTHEGITTLFQALKPQFYDLLVEATQDVAKYDVDQEYYTSPTFAINFGTTLKQCCEIALNNVLKRKIVYGTNVTLKAEDDIKRLMELISEKWRFDVASLVACQDLSVGKGDEVTVIPIISNASNLNDNRNNNINKNNEIKQQKCKRRKGKRRVLVPWTEKQKKLVMAFFEKHIEAKRPPKQKECEELRGLYPDILHNKDWLKIKVFVQNKYSK